MNVIKGTKPAGRKWNIILDAVVNLLKYKKSTIYHAIYIKVFSDGTVSYSKVSTDDFINTTTNETVFTELTRYLWWSCGITEFIYVSNRQLLFSPDLLFC